MSMSYLTRDPISPEGWHQRAVDSHDGASVEFLGVVRGQEDGHPIECLEYEAYEPMVERLIARLVDQAHVRWPLHAVYVRHRIGRVAVGEVAVVIGVQSPHRDEAFAACRFLIDAIKHDVPIWKAAIGIDGAIFNTPCANGHRTD
jgi:molybdopterin synthase catalytic subunit